MALEAEIAVLRTIVGLSLLVLLAKILAGVFGRYKLPEVLGEILAGVIMGPYTLGGVLQFMGKPLVQINDITLAFAQMGGIIVLFTAGLEFTFTDILKAGKVAFLVAFSEATLSFFLGYETMALLGYEYKTALTIGAALCATSIAITVKVLDDMGKLDSEEARIMVNAAMIDDILSLVVLSIVVDLLTSSPKTDLLPFAITHAITALALWFVLLMVSALVIPRLISAPFLMRFKGAIESAAIVICFGLAVFATTLGFSPIVGAFIAGVAVAESKVIIRIREYIEHLNLIFAPIFFALIGAYIEPSSLASVDIPLLVLLSAVAIAGKLIGCSIPVYAFTRNGLTAKRVGIGMISRGEMGFIIAGLALSMRIVDRAMYATLIGVIALSTLITPIWLKRTYEKAEEERE